MALLIGTVLLGREAAGETARERDLQIRVLVYNYARVPVDVLDRAQLEAVRIYHHIRIKTEWLACPLTPSEESRYPSCQVGYSPTTVALRLASVATTPGLDLPADSFGFALMAENGRFGSMAIVFAHRTTALAGGDKQFEALLLGHLMAHEVGHLLLGVGSHTAAGLMHVPWDCKELVNVSRGALHFMSWEGDKIRRHVAARVREQRTLDDYARTNIDFRAGAGGLHSTEN